MARKLAEEAEAVAVISEIEDDARIEEIIQSVIEDRAVIITQEFDTAIVYRPKRSKIKRKPFVFSDSDIPIDDPFIVVIPYTRAQYLALPRKKKKAVLMNVKKIISYRVTLHIYNSLALLNSTNPRVLARMEYLKERLSHLEKALPTAKLWENAVKGNKNGGF